MSKPSLGAGPLTFFHHNQPVTAITYLQPAQCDTSHLIGAVQRCTRLPRRPSKLPQTNFQRYLTT
jgi:hypothetical protein